MKGITLESIEFGNGVKIEKGMPVSFKPGSLKHSHVDIVWGGKTYRVPHYDIIATGTETIEDTDYCVQLQKELEKHDRLLIELFLDKDGVEYGYYTYFEEEESFPVLPQRRMFYRLVLQLAVDSSVDCYILSEKDKGGYNLLHMTSSGMFAKLQEFWDYEDGIKCFKRL